MSLLHHHKSLSLGGKYKCVCINYTGQSARVEYMFAGVAAKVAVQEGAEMAEMEVPSMKGRLFGGIYSMLPSAV